MPDAPPPPLHLAALPTPVERLPRLAAAIGLDDDALWVKRDDLTGLGGGGNKARKLDHLCADALARGCDTLLTGGGRQSNHVRMTAAAANRLGLGCTVVLASDPVDVPTGNVVLDHVLGPEIVWAGPLDYYPLEERIAAEAARLVEQGRRPYVMPIGGASAIGALGYVAAADELAAQLDDVGLVVVADGSGGTHAGLAAGFGDHGRVLGIDVGTRPDLDEQVPAKAAEAAALAGRPAPSGTAVVDHGCFGAGYGAPTDECRDALELVARTEGLLLDPVYTGKAMVGLLRAAAAGRLGGRGRTVFLHTGGLPAIFGRAFATWVLPR